MENRTDEILKDIPYSWMKESLVIIGVSGSRSYGTQVEGSDTDYRGVCIPPVEYHLGLKSFNEYRKHGGKNFKGDTDDVVIIHLNKFVWDALSGVPNNIEILFLDKEDYLHVNHYGESLISIRHHFLSKRIYNKFRGYSHGLFKGMKESTEGGSEYNTKYFMHAIRLLTSAIEILRTGDYSTRRPNVNKLLDCRNGLYTVVQAQQEILRYEEELQRAYEESSLPDNPDKDFINKWLIEVNLDYINSRHRRELQFTT